MIDKMNRLPPNRMMNPMVNPMTCPQPRLSIKKVFACVLAFVMVFGLCAGMTPLEVDAAQPTAVFIAARECGHDATAPGDHDPAECLVPGHYNCDGQTHEMEQCWTEYILGGGVPNFPGGYPGGYPGGTPGGGTPGGGTPGGGTPGGGTPGGGTPGGGTPGGGTPGGGIPGGGTPGGGTPGGGTSGGGGPGQTEYPDPPSEPPIPPGMEPPARPPYEIEVPEDGSDLDLVFDEEAMRELAQQARWRITCKERVDRDSNELFDFELIFSFDAVRHGGEGMFGEYFGVGMLSVITDTSRYIAMLPVYGEVEYEMTGPVENVFLELYDINALDDDVLLGPLFPNRDDDEDYVDSLIPEHMREREVAYGSANAIWRCTVTDNFFEFIGPYDVTVTGAMVDLSGDQELTLWVYAHDRGTVRIYIGGLPFSRTPVFYGQISQQIEFR